MQPIQTEAVSDPRLDGQAPPPSVDAAWQQLKQATLAHKATDWDSLETRQQIADALVTLSRAVRAKQNGVHCAEGTLCGSIIAGWAAGLGVFGTGLLLESLTSLWMMPESGLDIDITAMVQVLATCLAGAAHQTIHNLERRLLEANANREDPDTPRPGAVPRPPRRGTARRRHAKAEGPPGGPDEGGGPPALEDDGKSTTDSVGPDHEAAE